LAEPYEQHGDVCRNADHCQQSDEAQREDNNRLSDLAFSEEAPLKTGYN
jgi:hypothetical protein